MIYDSERKILEILWDKGDTTAKVLSDLLEQSIGWNRNTTYTVIKKCVAKGLVERIEPHFVCRALVSRDTARAEAANTLLDGWFGGSVEMLVCALLDRQDIPPAELAQLKKRLAEREGSDG